MGQGLLGAPHTYCRLKDIAMGFIPEPNAEDTIQGETRAREGIEDGCEQLTRSVAYKYFMDDDYGVATDFMSLYWFLHLKYFPRLSWARLTLKPTKTKFFSNSIDILGYEIQGGVGLRPSIDKVNISKKSLSHLPA